MLLCLENLSDLVLVDPGQSGYSSLFDNGNMISRATPNSLNSLSETAKQYNLFAVFFKHFK